MSERIYLFGGPDYNVLSFSDGIADLPDSLMFKEVTNSWGLEATEVNYDQFVHGESQGVYPISAREVRLRPRLPDARIREFGNAIIIATNLLEAATGAAAPVLFWDNSRMRNRFIASSDQISTRPATS